MGSRNAASAYTSTCAVTPTRRAARFILAAIPVVMLTAAIPLVNRTEPRVFGYPLLLVWITLWVLVAPAFLYACDRLRLRE